MSSSSADMREYCKQQYKMFAPVGAMNERKKETDGNKKALHAKMLDYMQRNGITNMQLAPSGNASSGDPTLQVVISKYYNPRPLSEEVIREAHINWQELLKPGRSPADQVEHIFKEIKEIRKRSSPLIKVQPCGKLNRGRLPFVQPNTPLFDMALDYKGLQDEIRTLKARVSSLQKSAEMERLEARALDELRQAKLKRRIYNIKGEEYVVRRTVRATTKKPTVKQLKQCIQQVVMEGNLDKRTFYAKLMKLLNQVNPRETKESVVFEKVRIKQNSDSSPSKRRRTVEQGAGGAPAVSGGLLVSRKTRMQHQRTNS